jgi:translation initiation factor 6 (eIF-6)
LRAYGTGKPTLLYLGKMEAGRATLGVIEHPDGLMAGRFSQGALVPSDERQVTLDAFKAAEQAARQVSSRFKAAGNAASARYYQGKAAQMQNQMD